MSKKAEYEIDDGSEPGSSLMVRSNVMDRDRHPDLDSVRSVVLRDGPRSRKVAKYTTIVDRRTGEIHHDSLTIQSFKKKDGLLIEKPEHSVSLSNEEDNEIQTLLNFITAAQSGSIPKESSDFVVVAAPKKDTDKANLQRLLNDLSANGKIDILADVFEKVRHDSDLIPVLLERAARHPQLFAEAAAALNLANYKTAVERLQKLADSDKALEAEFQTLLTENPWMFGSEYSELLDRRKWTRDEQQDFVLRRTTDGYIELIEIKTPLKGKSLFAFDNSHKTLYPGMDLSKVIGQVVNYIEKLDRNRDAILANDREDTTKIRAKIIIGRDGDAQQQEALRRLNGHLHRIEVITFDTSS